MHRLKKYFIQKALSIYVLPETKFRKMYLSFFFVFSVIFTALGRIGKSSIHNFKIAHYVFSYEYEFIKRGFIGQIFKTLNIPVTQISVFIFSFIILCLFIYLLYSLFFRCFYRYGKKTLLAFSFLVLVSPATFMHIGYDFARFDYINYVIMLFVITAYLKKQKWVIILSPLLILISLFIHEASIFITIPIIIILGLYENRTSGNVKTHISVLQIVAVILSLAFLFFYGKMNTVSEPVYTNNVLMQIGNPSQTHGMVKILYRSLTDNIYETFKSLPKIRLISVIVLLITTLYSTFYFLLIKQMKDLSLFAKILTITPFTVLPLFILGIDYQRWCSLFVTNLFVILPYLAEKNKFLLNAYNVVKQNRTKLYIYIILLIITVIGPFKVKL